MTKDLQVVILAAGKGTRMGLGVMPKVLMPLKGKPLIKHLLDSVNFIPKASVVLVVGFKYDLVQAATGNEYKYAFQQGQLGTGHAVMSALNSLDARNTLVLYGDMPFIKAETIRNLILGHEQTQSMITMVTACVPSFEEFHSHFFGHGRIVRFGNGKLKMIKEYVDATEEERLIKEVNAGIYLFNTDWLNTNLSMIRPRNKQKEFYLTDIVEVAVSKNISIEAVGIDAIEAFGINTSNDLKQAENLLSIHEAKESGYLRSRPYTV